MEEFITKLTAELQQQGYVIGDPASVPGVQALLYAYAPERQQMAFAKDEDHYLFVDWENTACGRLDRLINIADQFSTLVNQRFPMPHVLRLQIPNLVVAAVSTDPFPPDVARFTRGKNLTPWYGGETRQLMLVSIGKRQVISQVTSGPRLHPIPGAIPLGHATSVIRAACLAGFG
jgi:hypothetical protein